MNIIDEMRKMQTLAEQLEQFGFAAMFKRWAETLEQSGALVPVPDGKPCLLRRCFTTFLVWEGKVFYQCGDTRSHHVVAGLDGGPDWEDTVQPVRLVPITEAEI